MVVVENGETLVLRFTRKVSTAEIKQIYVWLEELSKQTDVKFVLLDESVEPVAVQKK
jgi:hypothetical protein